MQRESMRERLERGELTVGTLVSQMRAPALARILAEAGLHFFIIDCEHGSYTSETTADLCAMAVQSGISPFVRVPQISREAILRPLDAGADGIVVPQVDTVEQAEEVVFHAKYPPQGGRGAVVRRAHSGYRTAPALEFLEARNRDTLIAVQIESRIGLENCEAIGRVPGVDMLFIGPFDLSVSLGYPGDLGHEEVDAAMRRVIQTAQSLGKVAAIHLANVALGPEWVGKGAQFVSLGGDIEFLIDGARAAMKSVSPEQKP